MAQHKWFHDPIDKKHFEEQMEILKWSEIGDIAYSPYTHPSILEGIYHYWANRDRRKRGRDDFAHALKNIITNKNTSDELFDKVFDWGEQNDEFVLAYAIESSRASEWQVNRIADKGLEALSFDLLHAIARSHKTKDKHFYELIEIGKNWSDPKYVSPLVALLSDPRLPQELVLKYEVYDHPKAPSSLIEKRLEMRKEGYINRDILLLPNLDLEVAIRFVPDEIDTLKRHNWDTDIKRIETKLINPFLRSKGYLLKNIKAMTLKEKLFILDEMGYPCHFYSSKGFSQL